MKSRRMIWAVLLLSGCGTTLPSKELVDARDAYDKVSKGPAAQLKPDQVHEAKISLDQAEQSFNDDGNSDKSRDLAYIAQRKSQLAAAEAGQASAAAQRDQAARDLLQLQNQGLQRAQGELSKTKQQLAANAQRLEAAGQQLQAAGQQLQEEKKARLEAEKRARDAMDKLAVAGALAVKDEARGTVITMSGQVLFQSGKADLLPGAQQRMLPVAQALKDNEDHKIMVEGHTDSQGTESSNMDLAQRRADMVRSFFVSQGIPSDRITAVGVGQGRPIADNRSAEGRAQNRRVEVIIQPIEKR
jgi:outer membrane protein OmpA-like peptidoglycan-associated protein